MTELRLGRAAEDLARCHEAVAFLLELFRLYLDPVLSLVTTLSLTEALNHTAKSAGTVGGRPTEVEVVDSAAEAYDAVATLLAAIPWLQDDAVVASVIAKMKGLGFVGHAVSCPDDVGTENGPPRGSLAADWAELLSNAILSDASHASTSEMDASAAAASSASLGRGLLPLASVQVLLGEDSSAICRSIMAHFGRHFLYLRSFLKRLRRRLDRKGMMPSASAAAAAPRSCDPLHRHAQDAVALCH